VLIAETGPVSERVRAREIDDDGGRRLVRIIRRGSGSVVTWRRAQMVLLPAQGMDVTAIAKVAFTSEDRVRDVIRDFNADGFGSLYPRYKGWRPPKFTPVQRREIKKIAKARPAEYDLPFSTWSLAKLADFLVAEGVVDGQKTSRSVLFIANSDAATSPAPYLRRRRHSRIQWQAAAVIARRSLPGVRNELVDGLELIAGGLLRGIVLGEDVGHDDRVRPGQEAGRGQDLEQLGPVHVAVTDLEVLMHSSAVAGRVGDVPQPVRATVIEAVGSVDRP
jgi:transposase